MRRDVYIENDSGGFSVLAADAVDAIIADQRSDDGRFVSEYKALLLELYGDDSVTVRMVVDEPLRPDEKEQWLARATWRIDSTDGRMLVMGGFDPDVLTWWKEGPDEKGDGRGVAAVPATTPGSWRVDVYAHVGSMNGQAILRESDTLPGAAFRRSHPGRAFPLWLANMLEFSGEEDPGFEALWRDAKASMTSGNLAIDLDSGDAIGFLVHFTRSDESPGAPPEEIWFGRSDNSRVPKSFPLGLVSEAPDPELRSFHDKLLGIEPPEYVPPIATGFVGIVESWRGQPRVPVEGGPVTLALSEIYFLHWMAALTADSTPRFEFWINPKPGWTPPASTADYAVASRFEGLRIAIGPVPNSSGWHTWWAARDVVGALANLPDETEFTVAIAPRYEELDEDANPAVGLAMYGLKVRGGTCDISEASPKVTRETLEKALQFVRDLTQHKFLHVRPGSEREAFDRGAAQYLFEQDAVVWTADRVSLAEHDERSLLMVAGPVFKARFGNQWPVNAEEDTEDEED